MIHQIKKTLGYTLLLFSLQLTAQQPENPLGYDIFKPITEFFNQNATNEPAASQTPSKTFKQRFTDWWNQKDRLELLQENVQLQKQLQELLEWKQTKTKVVQEIKEKTDKFMQEHPKVDNSWTATAKTAGYCTGVLIVGIIVGSLKRNNNKK